MAPGDVPPPVVPSSRYAKVSDHGYDGDDTSRLAVYIYDTDSKWLDVAHSLKSAGVPFFLTTSIDRATEFSTIVVYPYSPPSGTDGGEAQKLINHMNAGNTVIFSQIDDPAYNNICGIISHRKSTDMSFVAFNDATSGPTKDFTDDAEKNLDIWSDWISKGWVVRLYEVTPEVTVLANYLSSLTSDSPTIEAAIFSKDTANGGMCMGLFGDIGQAASASHKNQMQGTGRYFSSHYDPSMDMFFRLIRNVYHQNAGAVTIHPIMDGKKVATIITHDCDANEPEYWAEYAAREHAIGVNASYMIFTKINADGYELPFFYSGFETFVQVAALGHELGSHSVAHSPNFEYREDRFFDYTFGDG